MKAWGQCNRDTRTIQVRQSAKGLAELDTYVHEFLHACFWDLDEEAVTESADAISRFLWRKGYRRDAETP